MGDCKGRIAFVTSAAYRFCQAVDGVAWPVSQALLDVAELAGQIVLS